MNMQGRISVNNNELHEIILEQLKTKQPLWSNWNISEKIGSGGYSYVYKITAERSGRVDVAAMKVEPIVPSESAMFDDERRMRSIERKRELVINESNIMHKLKYCPNIVSYEDESFFDLIIDGKNEGCYFCLRMEYLSCLGDLLKKRGAFELSETNVRKLANDIANGIKAAHDMGIIHRDLKPSNIFLDETSGTFKLGDFNISKETEYTRTFAGTNGYLAPEVYKSKSSSFEYYTKLADIYSFGICLYVLMNDLYMPFEREENLSLEEAVDMRMRGTPISPPANCSASFANIILRACEYDSNDRYQSIDDLIRDLKKLEKVPVKPYRHEEKPVPETPHIDENAQNNAEKTHEQNYASSRTAKAFDPVPLIAVILALLLALGFGRLVFMLFSGGFEEELVHITELTPNMTDVEIDIYENIEITDVDCPDVIEMSGAEPTFGYKYTTELMTMNTDLVIDVNDGAADELKWDVPEGLWVSAVYSDGKYLVTFDAADSFGTDKKCAVTFYNEDKSAVCNVNVNIKNTGPFKDELTLSSNDESVISFNKNNKFILHAAGEAEISWNYGGEVKYTKEIIVKK